VRAPKGEFRATLVDEQTSSRGLTKRKRSPGNLGRFCWQICFRRSTCPGFRFPRYGLASDISDIASANPDIGRFDIAHLRQFPDGFAITAPRTNGEDDRPVVANRPRKSSGSETTFTNDLTGPAGIEAGVLAMADQVWSWCEKANAFGRIVTVKIKYADFRQATRSQSLSARITSVTVLRETRLDLVWTVFPPVLGVRLVGVAVSNFGENQVTAPVQFDLVLTA
jgi:nucleotidyltransferase/DNA polymerase involved in DNA repair